MVRVNASFIPNMKLNEHCVVDSVSKIDIWRNKYFPTSGFLDTGPVPEGLVIVPLTGIVFGRHSSTRYAKLQITGDILVDGVIKEVPRIKIASHQHRFRSPESCEIEVAKFETPQYEWSDTALRDRADKTKPNSPLDLEELLKAPDIAHCLQELARGCDWEFDWESLPGLGKDYYYLPRDNSVPAETWLALYTMRSTVPMEFSTKVQEWLTAKLKEISEHDKITPILYEEDYDYCGVHHMMSQGFDTEADIAASLKEKHMEELFHEEEEKFFSDNFEPVVRE
jgi:hypothetical protein